MKKAEEVKIAELAKKYGMSKQDMKDLVHSQFEFIHDKIVEIDFNDNMTKEEFDEKKTNFNIPCIAKMYASHHIYKEINKKK